MITVSSAVVRRDNRVVATLRYSGKVITVTGQPAGKAIGRLMPPGYHLGAPDDGSGCYDAWTARHPAVHTPGDVILGERLTLVTAISLILDQAVPVQD